MGERSAQLLEDLLCADDPRVGLAEPGLLRERDDVAGKLLLHQQRALGEFLEMRVGFVLVAAYEHLAQQVAHRTPRLLRSAAGDRAEDATPLSVAQYRARR